jgi:hypothetical protein
MGRQSRMKRWAICLRMICRSNAAELQLNGCQMIGGFMSHSLLVYVIVNAALDNNASRCIGELKSYFFVLFVFFVVKKTCINNEKLILLLLKYRL